MGSAPQLYLLRVSESRDLRDGAPAPPLTLLWSRPAFSAHVDVEKLAPQSTHKAYKKICSQNFGGIFFWSWDGDVTRCEDLLCSDANTSQLKVQIMEVWCWWTWLLLATTSPCLASSSRHGRAYSEFLPPVVRPQREQVVVQARRPITLACEGHKPVVWNPPPSVAMSSR